MDTKTSDQHGPFVITDGPEQFQFAAALFLISGQKHEITFRIEDPDDGSPGHGSFNGLDELFGPERGVNSKIASGWAERRRLTVAVLAVYAPGQTHECDFVGRIDAINRFVTGTYDTRKRHGEITVLAEGAGRPKI